MADGLNGFLDGLRENISRAWDEAEAEYEAASAAEKFEIDRKAVCLKKRSELWKHHIDAGGNSRDPGFWRDWRGIEVSDGEVRDYRDEKVTPARWAEIFGLKEEPIRKKVKHRRGRVVFVHMNGYPEYDGTGCPLEERTF